VYLAGRKTEKIASNFLAEASALKVNDSNLSDLRALGKKYQPYVIEITQPCTESHCGYTFAFANPALKWLRWLVNTSFSANIGVSENRIVWRSLFLTTTYPLKSRHHTYLLDVLESSNMPRELPQLSIPSQLTVTPVATSVGIRIKPSASDDDHRIAYSLDLNCLGSIRGCTDLFGTMHSR
jgi:hypothetical protein